MSTKRLRDHARRPMTMRDQHRLFNAEENAPASELLDPKRQPAGVDPGLYEHLTLADLANLGVRIVQPPPPRRGPGRPPKP